MAVVHATSDDELFRDLERGMAAAAWRSEVSLWHKGLIDVGELRHVQMIKAIREAHILVPLLSIHLLASDEWPRSELRAALCRRDDECRVQPVLLRSLPDMDPFAERSLLPSNGIAVQRWALQDDAWSNVVGGLGQVVRDVTDIFRSRPQSLFDLLLGEWALEIRSSHLVLARGELCFSETGFSCRFLSGDGPTTTIGTWTTDGERSVVLRQAGLGGTGAAPYSTSVRFSLVSRDLMKGRSSTGEEVVWHRRRTGG